MSKRASKESKLSRCLKAPIRALSKARDFYVNGMTHCAGKVDYGGSMGGPTAHVSNLPKSFSVSSTKSSNDDDLRDLIRIASTRSLSNKVELEVLRRQQSKQSPETKVVPRSQSVAIGRIDEDKSCEFSEDVKVNMDQVYPRSKSYAVTVKRGLVV